MSDTVENPEIVTFFEIDKFGLLNLYADRTTTVRRIASNDRSAFDIDPEVLKKAISGIIIQKGGEIIVKADDTSCLQPKVISTVGYFHHCASNGLFVSSDRAGRHGDFLPRHAAEWEGIPMQAFARAAGGKLIHYHGGLVIRPTDKSMREPVNALVPLELKPRTAVIFAENRRDLI